MVDASIARHFSHAAAGYSRLRSAGPLKRIRSTEQAAVQEVADVSPGSLVLDAGCGDGATLEWLHARGALAVGVDLTIAMANLSRARGYPAAVQDLEELGLRPVFDRVLCIGVLEFVPDPARALQNLGACLAPDGKLVLLYPRKGPLGLLYAWYHRTHGARIHLFGTGDIASLLARAGLDPPTEHRACSLSSVCASSLPERNL
jgi:2-polyprenyl-3-methyl-5-hydroxy-6-metoxy-1,4-benzoquinol methylase